VSNRVAVAHRANASANRVLQTEARVTVIDGLLFVRPEDRDAWVDAHREVLTSARSFPGCIDLFVAAGPADAGRVNMFELWESEEALAASRAAAEPPPRPEILDARVLKYQISSSGPPF
jgi:quinol monooxygenase YgiN